MGTAPRSDSEREEIARRGDEIYGAKVRPHLAPEDEGKFVLIDIDSGDHELDRDEVAASDRLLARHPDAQVWMLRIGSPYARRLGSTLSAGAGLLALRYAHEAAGCGRK